MKLLLMVVSNREETPGHILDMTGEIISLNWLSNALVPISTKISISNALYYMSCYICTCIKICRLLRALGLNQSINDYKTL